MQRASKAPTLEVINAHPGIKLEPTEGLFGILTVERRDGGGR